MSTNSEPNTLDRLLAKAKEFIDQSISTSTKRAYRADWRHFSKWCQQNDLDTLPAKPKTVAGYISAMATGATQTGQQYKASTIERRLTTIRVVHNAQGYDDPTNCELVSKVWKGLRRDKQVDIRERGRRPLLSDDIQTIVDALDGASLKGIRDRAIILVGFAMGARRSELRNLDVGDIEFCPEGAVVRIRTSKTDQEAEGRKASIQYGDDYCPITALRQWLSESGIEDGPVFRSIDRWGNLRGNRLSGKSINRVVKNAASDAGVNPKGIGAHSLRAGHVTQRKLAGESSEAIMQQTGHAQKSTLNRYDRAAKAFRYDVSESLGL